MCFSSQYSYGGCLFILVRFLSYGVEYLQMWALVRRLSGGIEPWCVGVGRQDLLTLGEGMKSL